MSLLSLDLYYFFGRKVSMWENHLNILVERREDIMLTYDIKRCILKVGVGVKKGCLILPSRQEEVIPFI